jgi:hypothetical protein
MFLGHQYIYRAKQNISLFCITFAPRALSPIFVRFKSKNQKSKGKNPFECSFPHFFDFLFNLFAFRRCH